MAMSMQAQLAVFKYLVTQKMKGVEKYPHMDWSFFSAHLAMRVPPQYRAAEFDPDIDQAWVLNAGYESLEDLNEHWRDILKGLIPSPRPNCAVNTNRTGCFSISRNMGSYVAKPAFCFTIKRHELGRVWSNILSSCSEAINYSKRNCWYSADV